MDSLKRSQDSTGDDRFRDNFRQGLRYFKDIFFEESGCPRYYHNRTQPIDIQCASQGIESLAFCADEDLSCLGLSMKVARWTIDNMQDPTGYFYFRKYPMMIARTPYIHWGQATMFKALTTLQRQMTVVSTEEACTRKVAV